jgi:hypothetical protein
MAEWLSEEWLEAVSALADERPPLAGASGTVSMTVADGRKVHGGYHWSYKDGAPSGGAPGPAGGADVVLTISTEDAKAVADEGIEPSVAFMRGRLKTSGDNGLLLQWLASTATDDYAAWRRKAQAALGAIPPA